MGEMMGHVTEEDLKLHAFVWIAILRPVGTSLPMALFVSWGWERCDGSH
jgi:hypothetical protein